MFGQKSKNAAFFDQLCFDYYEKILRYLYYKTGGEIAARDCTQEVFVIAWEKCSQLQSHPNIGGFLFQTAKNLAKKYKRESFLQMMNELPADSQAHEIADSRFEPEHMLDRLVDEEPYIEDVLSRLSPQKRELYRLYYTERRSMREIAAMLELEEATVRMRYVRLRREIIEIVKLVSEEFLMA